MDQSVDDHRGIVEALQQRDADLAEKRVREVAEGTAMVHGATVEINYRRGYPVTVNHEAETGYAAEVARDVAGGYVSEAAARDDYGVVLVDGVMDEAATEAFRASMSRHTWHFHFGPERAGYEAHWTYDAYDLLTDILADLPIHWRFFAKTEVFRRMKGRSGAAGVAEAFEEVCARFPELPRPAAYARAAE